LEGAGGPPQPAPTKEIMINVSTQVCRIPVSNGKRITTFKIARQKKSIALLNQGVKFPRFWVGSRSHRADGRGDLSIDVDRPVDRSGAASVRRSIGAISNSGDGVFLIPLLMAVFQ